MPAGKPAPASPGSHEHGHAGNFGRHPDAVHGNIPGVHLAHFLIRYAQVIGVNLKLGGQQLDNLMVAPKSSAQQVLPAGAGGTLSWQSVNDYGAITPARSVNL